MRIPLDYYRILGLPIQATTDQLQQAHRDRTLQLPRREYSEVAIAARKQLIDEAYAVLSDPERRRAYDASFLDATPELNAPGDRPTREVATAHSSSNGAETYTPTIDIRDEQLVGALLILLELGEYELVLKLGRPYLKTGSSAEKDRFKDLQLAKADIVLTLALACLELGREQWQQGAYENAAESLETGQKLLLQEGLFASVRGELQSDIYRLRPYRILELLAQAEEKALMRRQGLQMLRDMLQERGGIDGTGNDQSGLGIDDFLRFIQQLRGYLTAKEQQSLFEAEALRPSAVATYLAVYALLAQGFAEHKPALIARAKRMLVRLGSRQDVHLEQAVCALLLGQTEEASRALELSQEYEPLAFIREHSQGSPDLLPGLCLYGERWLQEEVFPHFRDLKDRRSSLKDYFADEQVQAELESLPSETDEANEWAVVQHRRTPMARTEARLNIAERSPLQSQTSNNAASIHQAGEAPTNNSRAGTATLAPATSISSRPSTSAAPTPLSGKPAADRTSTENRQQVPIPRPSGDRANRRPGNWRGFAALSSNPPTRLLLLGAIGILSAGLLWFLATRTVVWLSDIFAPVPLEGEQPQVQLDSPPLEIPDPDSAAPAATGPLDESGAQQVIQAWLTAKSEALGQEHQTEQLEQILVDPALSKWQLQAEQAEQGNWYAQYEHDLTVESVDMSQVNPDQALVEAVVSEKADFYENGQLDSSDSYNDENLRVRYELIRKDGQWRIQDMVVLN